MDIELLKRDFLRKLCGVKFYSTFAIAASFGLFLFLWGYHGKSLQASMLLAGGGLLAFGVLWKLLFKPPKVPKDRIGILIAITTETSQDESVLRSDFLKDLVRAIEVSPTGRHFFVHCLPSYQAERISNYDEALALSNRCEAHFVVYGDMRLRKQDSKAVHALRLDCIVRHRPIESESRNALSREMLEAIPQRLIVDCENALSDFEVTSTQFAFAAKYIIASAAFISGDMNLARSLLEDLHAHIDVINKRSKAVGKAKLPHMLVQRLGDVCIAQILTAHYRWRQSRDDALLVEIENTAQRVKQLVGVHKVEVINSLAITSFVLRRDVKIARQYLVDFGKLLPKSSIWRYGLAFLDAYEGKMDDAWKNYKIAFSLEDDVGVPFEVEEFIDWAFAQEPDKVQLLFCLGVVNLKAKRDLERAKADFTRFLELCPCNSFEEQQNLARKYLGR